MFADRLAGFWPQLQGTSLQPHLETFQRLFQGAESAINQGDLHRWLAAYEALPELNQTRWVKDQAAVTVEYGETAVHKTMLFDLLQALHPWRKGPFQLGSVVVDAEWCSNLKWQRLLKGLPALKHKTVLDIGCGNGYYLFRMAEQQPQLLLGIEPGLLQNVQFWAIEKYVQSNAAMLPLKVQDLPADLNCFDVVFSMGVLYHRKSPLEHLEHIKSMLSAGGEMVLETLVVSGDEHTCLVPPGRYAQMRNVFFLPSVLMLQAWIKKVGFKSVEVIDVSATTSAEQRTTDWMRFHSLSQFINTDQTATNEGHPPPLRAILKAGI